MNALPLGSVLILGVVIGVGILALALICSRPRRKGRMVVASLLLLMLVLGVSLFFVRIVNSRAMAERDRAVAMRDQAMHREIVRRQSTADFGVTHMTPDSPEDPGAEEDVDDEYGSNYRYTGRDPVDTTVDEVRRKTDETIATLNSEIEATCDALATSIQGAAPPLPPAPPEAPQPAVHARIRLPDRSTRAQIVTAILLAGVVLAGYFFLNANTRGHYTWRLRIGSTLVFAASLAVVLLLYTT